MTSMTRHIIEEINSLFYVSINPAFSCTRNGQPIRINAYKTRQEAENQIAVWAS